MFAVAAVAGTNPRFGLVFRNWLRCLDPAADTCPFVLERRFEWGAICVGGASRYMSIIDNGSRGLLILHGAVFIPDFPRELGPNENVTELARRLLGVAGQFVVVAGSPQGLVCGTDNLGMKPFFSAKSDDGLYASNHSSLCGLLAGRTEPDFAFARDIVVRDAVLPTASLVAGVDRLARGSALEMHDGLTRVTGPSKDILWRVRAGRNSAIESLRESARVVGRSGRELLLGLTGGKDSRLTMAALLAEDVSFEAGTHAMPSRDGDVAERLARSVGLTFYGIPRAGPAVYPALSKYLALLPWSEGTLPLASPDQWFGVHDLAASRGMVHLGGLGGEVARAYWDQEEAAFGSAQQVIESRFFGPRARLFFGDPRSWEQSRAAWLALVEPDAGIDPFVSAQLIYLDTRLRGMIALRTNCAVCDYYWTLSTPELYAYALSLPRLERQRGTIFEDLIGELFPQLLSVEWTVGNAGIVYGSGVRGALHRARNLAKTVPALHRLRGRLQSVRPGRPVAFSRCVREEFLADAEVEAWLMEWMPREAIEMLRSGSSTFIAQAEKCVTMRLAHVVLEAIRNGESVPARLWNQTWLAKSIERMPEVRIVSGRSGAA